jgi:hypothetical protein
VQRPERIQAIAKTIPKAAGAVPPAAATRSEQAVDASRDTKRQTSGQTANIHRAQPAKEFSPQKSVPASARPGPRGADSLDRPSIARATAPRIALAKPRVEYSAEDIRAILVESNNAASVPNQTAGLLNVGELLARAAGYSFGLRTIDSVLHEPSALDTAELSRLLGELEALMDQRHDLLLYQQLVSADVRERLLRSLDYPESTVAQFGSRIAAVREQLSQRSGLAAADRESLQTLAELSKRLSRLSRN